MITSSEMIFNDKVKATVVENVIIDYYEGCGNIL